MRRFNTAITGASLAIGLIAGVLLMAPAAHAQRYLVNGHPASAREEQVLASYGFAAGAWRMNGWGISLDAEHADFVSEPRLPQCHYVLDVPLDCGEMQIASR
jgi:hypothetical protein